MKEEYTPYKIVHHKDRLEVLKEGGQPIPLQVHIVPSNSCNQRCSFCAYRMKGYLSNETFNPKESLSWDKISSLLDDFKEMGVKAVQYTGGGEPLVHPNIKDSFCKTFDNGLELALVSNGYALNDGLCDILGDATWVRISVDAYSKKLYSFIRNVHEGSMDIVINNIKNLISRKRTVTLGVGFVVEKENYMEVYESAKFFKELGVDNFRISAAFTTMGYSYFKDFEEVATDLCAKAAELSTDSFQVFNLFDSRLKDNFLSVQDYSFCPIKDLQVFVGADFNVYTCCTLAYNKKGLIGSVANQSFKELWESPAKIKMYEGHNPKQHCTFPCMYRGKNEFINYCIKKDPKHVNFI